MHSDIKYYRRSHSYLRRNHGETRIAANMAGRLSADRIGGDGMAESDKARVLQMINGFWVSQIIHAAAKFSLAEHLARGPATAAEIAAAAGTNPQATFRLLRTCASLGLVICDPESRFATTSLLDTLRKDHPEFLSAIMRC